MSAIFGGSKQSSTSSNQAYPYLRQELSGQVNNGNGANNLIAGLLGTGGDPAAAASGLQAFRNSAGYQSQLDTGLDAINSNAAARGLLNSGSTLKGLTRYGQELGSSFYDKYLNNLFQQNSQGLQAAGIIGGAGGQSTQKSSSKPGLGGFLGAVL